MHNHLRVKASPPFFLHPVLHAPHRSHPRDDHGRNEPKEGEDRARGEAFTHNTLTFNTLQTKGEEVKAKSRKTLDARASRVRVGRSPRANLRPSWAGDEKTPLGAPPSQENIVTSQSVPRPSSRTWGHRIVEILDRFDTLTNSISEGLPREIALRSKQYENYRDALLRFPSPALTA